MYGYDNKMPPTDRVKGKVRSRVRHLGEIVKLLGALVAQWLEEPPCDQYRPILSEQNDNSNSNVWHNSSNIKRVANESNLSSAGDFRCRFGFEAHQQRLDLMTKRLRSPWLKRAVCTKQTS
ncbi:hypothetical protein PoB_005133000 [Plakobranchus ocellatus]|uniref:Uncharacterized protein n=1 Tax=Plakobranchus ocellatus TaxID=259542 RepID=A0AAV4C0C7_9GAST|nr:hypothetical protein PoB_005133000 [Plakobranchus ocellatus]